MSTPLYVEGLLIEWGETFFDKTSFWGPVRRAQAGGKAIRARGPAPTRTGGDVRRGGGRLNARSVRARLTDLVRASPQAMVKVYGGGRGMKQVRAHLRYIARAGREGEVPVEDQDGFRTQGVEAIRELADDWQYGEVKVAEQSVRREAVNIVLSMPAGTDPIGVQKAARDFAALEFRNHKYAMALHTIDTPHYDDDKNDPPSPHPHVHLVVQSAGADGRRLNPRKADLHRWREGFAQALRDHGVDAIATSRAYRLERRRGQSQAIRQMKDLGKPFTKGRRAEPSSERVARAKSTEKEILRRYSQVIQILVDSQDPADRVLSMALADRFGLQRPMPTMPDAGRKPAAGAPEVGSGATRPRTGTDDLER
jgi:hypothetical protein